MTKNITVSIKDDIAAKMEKFKEVNWSEICREAIEQYIRIRELPDLAPYLERLHRDKQNEFERGREFARTNILGKIPYARLERLFSRIQDIGETNWSYDEVGQPYPATSMEKQRDIDKAILDLVLEFHPESDRLKDAGRKARTTFSSEFARGIREILMNAWERLQSTSGQKGK